MGCGKCYNQLTTEHVGSTYDLKRNLYLESIEDTGELDGNIACSNHCHFLGLGFKLEKPVRKGQWGGGERVG